MEIWFRIVNGQISCIFDSVICTPKVRGRLLSFHVFIDSSSHLCIHKFVCPSVAVVDTCIRVIASKFLIHYIFKAC